MDATTKWLIRTAEDEVRETLRSLPTELRGHATDVTVIYEAVPGQALINEGWEADLLGMFAGNSLGAPLEAQFPVPPQILLFYENLWALAEGDEAFYREEVRITYLHELGHYLGLDEDELDQRGLL